MSCRPAMSALVVAMTLSTMLAPLSSSLAADTSDWKKSEIDAVIAKFREACMQGRAKFAPGEIRALEASELPSDLRRSYGRIRNARFYEMRLSRVSYLINWERKPSGTYYTRGCAVAASGLPFMRTWEKVLKTEFTSREEMQLREVYRTTGLIEFPLPEEGSKLSLDRIFGGRFIAVQVSAMSKYETNEWKTMWSLKPYQAESAEP
jgi:hypothetical protein